MIVVFKVCELIDFTNPMYGGRKKVLYENSDQNKAIEWMHTHCPMNPPPAVATIRFRYASEANRKRDFSLDEAFVAANYF